MTVPVVEQVSLDPDDDLTIDATECPDEEELNDPDPHTGLRSKVSAAVKGLCVSFGNIVFSTLGYKSLNASLMNQFRNRRTQYEREYWWNMAHPPEQTAAQELAALDRAMAGGNTKGGSLRSLKRKLDDQTTAHSNTDFKTNSMKCNGTPAVRHPKFKAIKCFFDRLARADVKMYDSRRNKIRFDGVEYPNFSCQNMIDTMRKNSWSAEKTAEKLGYYKRTELKTMPDQPWMGVDNNDVPMLYVLPGLYGKIDKDLINKEIVAMADRVKLSRSQADRRKRGSNYVCQPGRLAGCLNAAISWVPLFRKKTDPLPSAGNVGGCQTSITRTAQAFHAIQQYGKATMEQSTILNYVFCCLEYASYRAHLEMKTILKAKFASARTLSTWDPFVMLGRSYIFSRNTPLHFDNKEAPEGWAPLVVMGDCTTGMLAIPRLGIKVKYLPGTVVFIRGRLLDHEVVEWNGEGLRICIAHFNHESEWLNAGVTPVL